MKARRAGLGIVLGGLLLLGFYQNCAPQGSVQNHPDNQIVRAMDDESNDETAAAHSITSTAESSKVTLERCEFRNLNCFRKVYSPEIDDASGPEALCLDVADSSTCLNVMTHMYNTQAALAACENCKAEDSQAGGEYNREEYTCWLGAPGAPTTTAFALRPTLEEAVQATLALCGGK